jgi:DNA repair protein RecO (recombination protein O)
MRFLVLAGLQPELTCCCGCGTALDAMRTDRVRFDVARGGLLCPACSPPGPGRLVLSKGTVKQLLWTQSGALRKAQRIRFGGDALQTALQMLETFVSFHFGRDPRSLKFLRQIRAG